MPSKAQLKPTEGEELHGKSKISDKKMFGGYSCEFVEPPASVFQTHCPICTLVVCDPHLTICCGINFCQLCGEQLQAKHMPCPTCREDNFKIFPNEGLKYYLNKLCVACTCKDSCNWSGQLRELEYHLNEAIEPSESFHYKQ